MKKSECSKNSVPLCLCAFVPSSSSGVAVIMVLGLLSVMVLMAVSFAIVMRTERLAAGNAADTLRARELVQVGLARAMDDLAVTLGTSGLSAVGASVYPNWNVTNSYTNTASWNYTNILIRKSATNYISRALWADATNADLTNPSNHWLPVKSVAPPVPGLPNETNLMGRVAYIILNCSGLLDANYAGGIPRASGTNPNEIAIEYLGEIGSAAAATDFITQRRNTDIRYETLADLNTRGNFHKPSTNLFVYSRALPGYWNTNLNCVGTQINLSGSAADLLGRREAITNAFVQAGFSQFESGVLYSNLIDYVDVDYIPSNLEYCVESVPMINEVVVSNNVTVAPGSDSTVRKYTIKPTVYVECWYPFVSNSSGSFDLDGSVTFSASGIFPAPGTFTVPFNIPLGTFLPGDFLVKICCNPSYSPPEVTQVPVRLISTISLSVKSGAGTVDQITIPITMTNDNDGASDSITYASADCHDPRFNSNPADINQWRIQTGATPLHTLGIINTWPGGLFPFGSDGDEKMFVANRPLRSVAELGYLVYSSNAPWCTVKLYGPNRHRVLDVFGLSTNVNDVFMTNTTVLRGLVNCNPNVATDATAVVFAGMPVDQYPGEVSVPPLNLDMNQGRSVADSIFNGGPYTNLSDIGRNITFPVGTTELQKESYFRNAFNLINLRQNVFTIIIEAQVASGGNIPGNPARQRAVAVVWRDPYTGEMFVRHIKWLGD